MKFASLKNYQSKDGDLCLVNRSLTKALRIPHIAPTLQYALDHWQKLEESLQSLYQDLNEQDVKEAFTFNPTLCTSPLPRAFQWADGSAYVNHVELVRKARGAEMPADFWTNPLMYQGGSDSFLGPRDPITGLKEADGIDFESELAIITDEVPLGINAAQATPRIKLFMLVNDLSLRNLIPQELAKGFGFFQSKPASSFSPVAITPDELGTAWDGQRVHLPLYTYYNDLLFGKPNAGVDMTFSFPELIAHAAKTRMLNTGTIIGSGTVSNLDRSQGSSCIAEKRMLEHIEQGEAKTAFMKDGDRIRIEMLDAKGQSLFGAIEQTVQTRVSS